MNIPERKLIVFVDHVGRTIVGQERETGTIVNPTIMQVVPVEGGRLNVQLIPLFFREFLQDKNQETVWSYQSERMVRMSSAELDSRIRAQYEQLFYTVIQEQGAVIPNAPAEPEPEKKIDLF